MNFDWVRMNLFVIHNLLLYSIMAVYTQLILKESD